MSLVRTIDAMVAAGCTPEQIAAVVRAHEEAREEKAVERRAKDAERQRRSRMSRHVTVTPRDGCDTPPKVSPHTPLPNPSRDIPPSPPKGGSSPAGFDEFWSLYPNKVGKRDAEKAFVKALKRASLTAILTGLRRYVAKTDDRPWCNPATWLNQDRWADEPAAPPPRRATDPPRERTVSDVLGDIAAGKWPIQEHTHEPDFLTIDASLSSRN